MKKGLTLPKAEKINAVPQADVEIPEEPETKKKSGPEGWIYLGLMVAMMAGLAFSIKYVFGFSLSALLIMASLSKEVTKKTSTGNVPLKLKDRVPWFVAGVVIAAFTILAHSKGEIAALISSWLIVGVVLFMPVYLLFVSVTESIRDMSAVKKRRMRCTETVGVEFKGLTRRGTDLPVGVDPMYGGNREYQYWYGGEYYRILLPADGQKNKVMTEITVDPEAPEMFYHDDIFEPIRKSAVWQLIAGTIFSSVVIAIILFVAGTAILKNM